MADTSKTSAKPSATQPLFIINNVGADIVDFMPEIQAALLVGDELPPGLADLITVTFVHVGTQVRARLDWA